MADSKLRSGDECHCNHCGFEGPCYGIVIGDKGSAPWCPKCQINNELVLLSEYKASQDNKQKPGIMGWGHQT